MNSRISAMSEDGRSFTSSTPLTGSVTVPGDKSITHRAILFGLLAKGTTVVRNWLDAADCRSSLRLAKMLGAQVVTSPGVLTITGTGGHLADPDDVLDCGNSGTTMRLFLGALAARLNFACLTGDASLRKRPMDRVTGPLTEMGAQFHARKQRFAPLAVISGGVHGIDYRLPVASAQVKSAVLIAGMLATDRSTTVVEPYLTRDHTENMLSGFGAQVERTTTNQGTTTIVVPPNQTLHGTEVDVPGDISSAAFVLAAAASVHGSQVTVRDVGLNPRRAGVLRVLDRMGADVQVSDLRTTAGESIGSVTVACRELRPTDVEPAEIPTLVDELPVIAVLAAYANGVTTVRGAGELRVKETDRIHALVQGLRAIGVEAEEYEDGFAVHGTGRVRGGRIQSFGDHRIAMSFAIAGMSSEQPVEIDDWTCVGISYPNFIETFTKLGYNV